MEKEEMIECLNEIVAYESVLAVTYFWELQLSPAQYRSLKDLLHDNRASLIIHIRNNNERIAKYVALYYAEWYKREYAGNNNKNAHAAIGIEDNINELVFNTAFPGKVGLFQHENGYREFEWSLYVKGGLPIYYIVSRENAALANDLQTLFSSIADEENNVQCELDRLGGNAVINDSYTTHGSIYSFIRRLIDSYRDNNISWPFSQEDQNVEPFQGFIQSVMQGGESAQRNLARNKFKLEWEASCVNIEQSVHLELALLICFNNNNDRSDRRNIPQNIVFDNWRLNNEMNHFTLIVKNGERVLKEFEFYQDGHGHFTSYSPYYKRIVAKDGGRCNIIGLEENRLDFDRDITIYCNYTLIQSISLRSPIKLRRVERNLWASSQKVGDDVALFVPNREGLHCETDVAQNAVSNSNSLWIPVTYHIQYTYYGQAGHVDPNIPGSLIIAIPEEELLYRDVIRYDDNQYVKYRNNNQEENVFLLRYGNANDIPQPLPFVVSLIDNNDKVTDVTDQANITPNRPNNNINLYTITCTYNLRGAQKRTECKCYFLPSNFIPRRHQINANIDFENGVFRQNYIHDNNLTYYVFVGNSGVYDTATRQIIHSGVLKFLDRYCYRMLNHQACKITPLLKLEEENINLVNRAHYLIYHNDVDGNNGHTECHEVPLYPYSQVPINRDGNNNFYLNRNSAALTDCQFFYTRLDENDFVPVPLELVDRPYHNNETRLQAAANNIEFNHDDGIIFQSLQDVNLTPNSYIKPYYLRNNNVQAQRQTINNYYRLLNNNNLDNFLSACVRDYEFARKHKLYYTFSLRLRTLIFHSHPEWLVRFFISYLHYCADNRIEVKFSELYRMAYNLQFDWWFIPEGLWMNVMHDNDRGQAEDLLRSKKVGDEENNAAKNRIVDSYWELNMDFRRRMNDPQNIIAQYIRNIGNDSQFFNEDNWNNRRLTAISFVQLAQFFNVN